MAVYGTGQQHISSPTDMHITWHEHKKLQEQQQYKPQQQQQQKLERNNNTLHAHCKSTMHAPHARTLSALPARLDGNAGVMVITVLVGA
jgi:hypothetical protein